MLELLKSILKGRLKQTKDKMSTFNVTLVCTTHSEMTVKANSLKEAREEAAIQLANMGWLEWEIDGAWRVKNRYDE